MATISLGKVKSSKGNTYEVKWDPSSHDLYVEGTKIGKATDAREAMYKAEAWAVSKH